MEDWKNDLTDFLKNRRINMKLTKDEIANLSFFTNFFKAKIQLEDLGSFLKEINIFIEEKCKRDESKNINDIDIIAQYKIREFTVFRHVHELEFGEILRIAFIVTLVILLEQDIRKYCDEFKEQLHLEIGWKDFRGAALDRFKLFINKLVKLKLSISNTIWKDLHSLVAIRNCLVHADGCLENFSEANKVKDFARRYNSLKIQDNFLQISLRTCEDCLKIVKNFVEAIYGDALLFFPGALPPKIKSDN